MSVRLNVSLWHWRAFVSTSYHVIRCPISKQLVKSLQSMIKFVVDSKAHMYSNVSAPFTPESLFDSDSHNTCIPLTFPPQRD